MGAWGTGFVLAVVSFVAVRAGIGWARAKQAWEDSADATAKAKRLRAARWAHWPPTSLWWAGLALLVVGLALASR